MFATALFICGLGIGAVVGFLVRGIAVVSNKSDVDDEEFERLYRAQEFHDRMYRLDHSSFEDTSWPR